MRNQFEQVMPDVIAKFKQALDPQPELSRVQQVQRYVTQHRTNPHAAGQFVLQQMRDDGVPEHELGKQFDKRFRQYVKDMEKGVAEEWRAIQKPPRV